MPSVIDIFSTTLSSKLILRSSPCVCLRVDGRIDSTAPSGTYYLHLWNAADVPVDGTAVTAANHISVPVKIVHTSGTDDSFSLNFEPNGRACSIGAVLGLSSTEFTQTAGGAYLSAAGEVE